VADRQESSGCTAISHLGSLTEQWEFVLCCCQAHMD